MTLIFAFFTGQILAQPTSTPSQEAVLGKMADLVSNDHSVQKEAAQWLGNLNDISIIPAFMDAMQLVEFPSEFDKVLHNLTGQKIEYNWPKWHQWLVRQENFKAHPAYRQFKRSLFMSVDPAIGRLLDLQHPSTIRWDEIVWGGVKRDAIPPLDQPKTLKATDAFYMDDDEDVFGISISDESLAFPTRILEWHEMANIIITETPLSLVYCVLCGAAIAYNGQSDNGRKYDFGTSGLLYRSNKLMYDRQTRSLWSSLNGQPVIGPLANSGINLKTIPVVRTTWKDWQILHPETRVLDIETGFDRNYENNRHYQAYLQSERTMFPVGKESKTLKPKDWVYGINLADTYRSYPIREIRNFDIIHDQIAGIKIILLRDSDFTIRVYKSGNIQFTEHSSPGWIQDKQGRNWEVKEDALRLASGEALPRISGHLAFWFAWYAFYPETTVFRKEGYNQGSAD